MCFAALDCFWTLRYNVWYWMQWYVRAWSLFTSFVAVWKEVNDLLKTFRFEYDVFSRSRHVLILSYRLNIAAVACKPFIFSRGYVNHRNDYLLGDRLCKCVTHSDVNFWPRTWRNWVWVSCRLPKSGHFSSCGLLLWKYLKLWEVWSLLLWWCIGQNSAAGEVKEVASCLLRFTRRGS